jgi:hypothetical protein
MFSALTEIANNSGLVPKLRARSLVIGAICGVSSTDAAAVGALGRIASDANMQACVAEALDRIHTRDTLPFLAQLLDSSDPKAREYAIGGMSRFVDNLPIQTPSNILNGKSLVPQGPAPYRTADTDRHSLSRGC